MQDCARSVRSRSACCASNTGQRDQTEQRVDTERLVEQDEVDRATGASGLVKSTMTPILVEPDHRRRHGSEPWLLAAVVAAPVQTRVRAEVLADLFIGVEDAYVDSADHVLDCVARHRTIRIEDQSRALVDKREINIAAASEAGIGQRTIKHLSRLPDAEE